MILFVLIVIVLVCYALIWIWHKRMEYFFRKHNIPFIPAPLFGGNLQDFIFRQKSMAELVLQLYNNKQTKSCPAVGVRFLYKNALIIQDVELIKRVLVKDFNSFSCRTYSAEKSGDPLGANNLFLVKNPLWHDLRSKITPLFSTVKMRGFFDIVNGIGKEFNEKLNEDIPHENTVDMKELNVFYMTDIYASCAFGIQANSIRDPNSEFGQRAIKMFDFTLLRALEFASNFISPEISQLLNWKFFSREGSQFLKVALTAVMNERQEKGIVRNDLMDLVVNLRNSEVNNSADRYSDDELLSQCAIFFVAGYETTSTAVLHALYELAKQPDLQKRLKDEMQTLLSKHGELSYDNLNELEYLTMVCKETFRLYPVFPFLNRECTPENGKFYSFLPEMDFDVPKGFPIYIPSYALHRDPRYFVDPDRFVPERFDAENNIPKGVYFPFGMGPRGCLAERLGYLAMKLGIFYLLKTHSVNMCDKTPQHIKAHKLAMLVVPEEKVYLRITKDLS